MFQQNFSSNISWKREESSFEMLKRANASECMKEASIRAHLNEKWGNCLVRFGSSLGHWKSRVPPEKSKENDNRTF